MRFYIYEEQMEGKALRVTERINRQYVPVVILADTKEQALQEFCKNIEPDERWRFFVREAFEADKEEKTLKELGYDSWDSYYEDMYPARPVEL